MKICITSQGKDLDSQVDPRFGRCSYFIIVDTDTMEFEAVDNSAVNAAGGAGIKSGQLIAEKGAKAVLTGNCGPNAFQTLNAAKIDVITGVSGTIKEAVNKFKSGELKPDKSASVDSHFGMK
ncbi:MAG: NifB/NifX family molybdenum-iron cluster-binding protein [Endomicrobiales bacterium]|nr:NifB/NifX family molybdenum-iron cluster-binding protein [Endomicrobiales bacterium]